MKVFLNGWLPLSIISLVLYGLWAFLPKLAVSFGNPRTVLFYDIVGGLIVAVPYFILTNFRPDGNIKSSLFALLAGIAVTLGSLCFFYALSKGNGPAVITVTALYPVVAILLSAVFLKEVISLKQGIGILFGIVAMILLAL